MLQVCVILCFTTETFEVLRSLSPRPPFPPFTASRASFLLLQPNCEFCECKQNFFQMCCTMHTPQSAILKCFSCLIFALPPVQCPKVLQCCCYCWRVNLCSWDKMGHFLNWKRFVNHLYANPHIHHKVGCPSYSCSLPCLQQFAKLVCFSRRSSQTLVHELE